MRCRACDADEHVDAAILRRAGVFCGLVRRAVRGEDVCLVLDAEILKDFLCCLHQLLIGAAAHDDANKCGH